MTLLNKTFFCNAKNFILNYLFLYFHQTFATIKGKGSKWVISFITSFLVLIIITNFYSVFSFNFPLTSQLRFVLYASLVYWLAINLFFIANNSKGYFIHIIPMGAPFYLIIFLFLIEGVRNLIRFVTLTVRLCANILAGHVLIILLRKLFFMYIGVLPVYLVLNLIEIIVSIIQSYIFCTIMILYYSEVR